MKRLLALVCQNSADFDQATDGGSEGLEQESKHYSIRIIEGRDCSKKKVAVGL